MLCANVRLNERPNESTLFIIIIMAHCSFHTPLCGYNQTSHYLTQPLTLWPCIYWHEEEKNPKKPGLDELLQLSQINDGFWYLFIYSHCSLLSNSQERGLLKNSLCGFKKKKEGKCLGKIYCRVNISVLKRAI